MLLAGQCGADSVPVDSQRGDNQHGGVDVYPLEKLIHYCSVVGVGTHKARTWAG